MPNGLADRLTKYLTDAHSIELHALVRLRQAPELAGDPQLADAFREPLPWSPRRSNSGSACTSP